MMADGGSVPVRQPRAVILRTKRPTSTTAGAGTTAGARTIAGAGITAGAGTTGRIRVRNLSPVSSRRPLRHLSPVSNAGTFSLSRDIQLLHRAEGIVLVLIRPVLRLGGQGQRDPERRPAPGRRPHRGHAAVGGD